MKNRLIYALFQHEVGCQEWIEDTYSTSVNSMSDAECKLMVSYEKRAGIFRCIAMLVEELEESDCRNLIEFLNDEKNVCAGDEYFTINPRK